MTIKEVKLKNLRIILEKFTLMSILMINLLTKLSSTYHLLKNPKNTHLAAGGILERNMKRKNLFFLAILKKLQNRVN